MFSINSRKLRTNLHDLGQAVNMITTGRWLFYCIIIGIIAGLFALLFTALFDLVQEFSLEHLAGISAMRPSGDQVSKFFHIPQSIFSVHQRWLLFILPAFGGLISGIIVYLFCPTGRGTWE